jgi:hypothetical protein
MNGAEANTREVEDVTRRMNGKVTDVMERGLKVCWSERASDVVRTWCEAEWSFAEMDKWQRTATPLQHEFEARAGPSRALSGKCGGVHTYDDRGKLTKQTSPTPRATCFQHVYHHGATRWQWSALCTDMSTLQHQSVVQHSYAGLAATDETSDRPL